MPRAVMRPLVALLATLGACSQPEPGGDVATAVPVDAPAFAYVASLGALREGAAGFAAGLEGASGAIELVAERFGLDLRSNEALDRVGLDVRGGLALFRADGATVFAASVHRPEAFMAHAELRLLRMLGARPRASGAEAPKTFVLPGESVPRVALGVTSARVGLVVVTDAAGGSRSTDATATGTPDGTVADAKDAKGVASTADAVWRRLAALGPGQYLAGAPRLETARLRGPVTDGAAIVVALDDPFAALADALPAMAGALVGGLGPWQGGIAVETGRLAMKLGADVPEGSALPVSWISGRRGEPPLAAFLPRNTPFFMRFFFNAEKLRRLPSFLVERMVPRRLPGFEMAPMPDVPALIEVLGDEVGVALFGLAPGVPLTALLDLRQLSARWTRYFRFAVLARIREPDSLRQSFELIAQQFATAPDWRVTRIVPPAGAAGLAGWTFVQGELSFAVVLEGKVAMFLVGAAELEGLMALREGRQLALTASLDGDGAARQVITGAALGMSDEVSNAGIHLGFLRVTRELVERGAPPYFVKVLNSIHSVALTLGATPTTVDLGLEVQL